MLLCDHAEVADGKLFVNGGGWDQISANGGPTGIAVLVQVPWVNTNEQKKITVSLMDHDGRSVTGASPAGETPIKFEITFEVGRPPGVPHGSDVGVPFALNFPPLALTPAQSYYWLVEIDGEEVGRASFRTRQT